MTLQEDRRIYSFIVLVFVWAVFLGADPVLTWAGNVLGYHNEALTRFVIVSALIVIALLSFATLVVFISVRNTMKRATSGAREYRIDFALLVVCTLTLVVLILSGVMSFALWGRYPGGMLG